MGPDAAAAAAADGDGVDPPLAPVPNRAGRVKVRRGWSNTTGELIRRVCEDVWVVERACTLCAGEGGQRGAGGGVGGGERWGRRTGLMSVAWRERHFYMGARCRGRLAVFLGRGSDGSSEAGGIRCLSRIFSGELSLLSPEGCL